MSNLKESLMAHISQERLIDRTSDMIRIESYYGIPNQETGVAEYVKAIFDANGIPCYLKEVADGRCNMIATLDSGVPGKTIMFNCHMDTVEPNGWEDAFNPRIIDGKLYGRGSIDDKGPLACVIEAMLAIKATGTLKKGKIILTGVLDEERNSIGTIDVVESRIPADAVIIAEETNFEIQTCQRGLEWLKFHFTGKAIHSMYQRQGINAISKAVKFCTVLDERLIPAFYAKTHPVLKEATINYGIIQGGTQLSTVAGECDVYVDTRFLPYQDYNEVIGEFQAVLDELAANDPDFKCEMSVSEAAALPAGYLHLPFETPVDHPVVSSLQTAHKDATGEDVKIGYMAAWTDGGLLARYGLEYPTVIMGPSSGGAHTNDEHIAVAELPKTALIYALTAVDFCQS